MAGVTFGNTPQSRGRPLYLGGQPHLNFSPHPATTLGNANTPTSQALAYFYRLQHPSPQAQAGQTGGSTSSYDPQAAAARAAADAQARQNDIQRGIYDQQIGEYNSALGRLPGQYDSQYANLMSDYNSAFNQLLTGKARSQGSYDTTSAQALQDYTLGKSQAKQTYDTTKQQTAQDYVGAKNTIGAQAGSSLNSLLRLLGLKGAGGSSASRITAPESVARNATIQRNNVGQDYGRNQQALDTSYNSGVQALDTNYGRNKNALDTGWQNYLSDEAQSEADLGNQRTNNQSALQAQINQSKADLLQKLAGVTSQRAGISGAVGADVAAAGQPFINQANDLLSQADALGRHVAVPLQAHPASYNAPALEAAPLYAPPSLESYTVNPNATPTYQGQPAANDYFSPYLSALLGRKRQAA